MSVVVNSEGCDALEFDLERDTILLLDGSCPEIEVEDEEGESASDGS
jgi:hypothetical protein